MQNKRQAARLFTLTALGTLLFAASMHCQTTLEVSVKGPKNTVKSTITINKLPTITTFACLPAVVNEGDTVTCTLTIDLPAPATGYTFPIIGTGVNIPWASVTVLANATTASFTFTAPPVPTAANKEDRRFFAMQFGAAPNSGLPNSWISVFQYYWSAL